MRFGTRLALGLGLLFCTLPLTSPLASQTRTSQTLDRDGLKAWVVRLSTKDPDPIPKLISLCLLGKEARGVLEGRMDRMDLPLLGWFAFNELALHEGEVSDEQWMWLLSRLGRTMRLAIWGDAMALESLFLRKPPPGAPRPRLIRSRWSSARMDAAVREMDDADPIRASRAMMEVWIAFYLHRLGLEDERRGLEGTRTGPGATSWRIRKGLIRSMKSTNRELRRRALLMVKILPLRPGFEDQVRSLLLSKDPEAKEPAMRAAALMAASRSASLLQDRRRLAMQALESSCKELRHAALIVLARSHRNLTPAQGDRIIKVALQVLQPGKTLKLQPKLTREPTIVVRAPAKGNWTLTIQAGEDSKPEIAFGKGTDLTLPSPIPVPGNRELILYLQGEGRRIRKSLPMARAGIKIDFDKELAALTSKKTAPEIAKREIRFVSARTGKPLAGKLSIYFGQDCKQTPGVDAVQDHFEIQGPTGNAWLARFEADDYNSIFVRGRLLKNQPPLIRRIEATASLEIQAPFAFKILGDDALDLDARPSRPRPPPRQRTALRPQPGPRARSAPQDPDPLISVSPTDKIQAVVAGSTRFIRTPEGAAHESWPPAILKRRQSTGSKARPCRVRTMHRFSLQRPR